MFVYISHFPWILILELLIQNVLCFGRSLILGAFHVCTIEFYIWLKSVCLRLLYKILPFWTHKGPIGVVGITFTFFFWHPKYFLWMDYLSSSDDFCLHGGPIFNQTLIQIPFHCWKHNTEWKDSYTWEELIHSDENLISLLLESDVSVTEQRFPRNESVYFWISLKPVYFLCRSS